MKDHGPRKKRRRIAPTPVAEEDAPPIQLDASDPVAGPVPVQQLVQPEPGRRIWFDLSTGYDFNYKKLLSQAGAKPQRPRPAHPEANGTKESDLGRTVETVASIIPERGNHVQRALERIQRRIQREQNAAVTGMEDSDEETDGAADVGIAGAGVPGEGEGLGVEVEGNDGREEKEEGEEEPEEEILKGPKNRYDVFDDFIDDTEFITAVENRDDRKTKHQGFFVNVGSVERIGEKPLPAKRKRRKGEAAGLESGAHKDAGSAGVESGCPPAVNGSTTRRADTGRSTGTEKRERTAGGYGQADLAEPIQPAISPGLSAAAPVPSLSPVRGAASSARPGKASSRAPMPSMAAEGTAQPRGAVASPAPAVSHATGGSGALHDVRLTADDETSRPPQGSVPVDMDSHAAAMRGLPIDIGEDHLASLPRWEIAPRLRHLLSLLRETAASTTPFGGHSKRKMPAGLAALLEDITRPFYITCERSTNINRAKKALWSVLVPILSPWITENTIKTKMQQVNARIVGQYAIERNRFEEVAKWVGNEHNRLNDPKVQDVVTAFIPKLAQYEGLASADEPAAELGVWQAACDVWESSGGCPLTPATLRSIQNASAK